MSDTLGNKRRGPALIWLMRGLITRWLAKPARRRAPRYFRVAIVKLDRLGDGILALGAIRTVLAHYGENNCLLVISPHTESLMAGEFPLVPRLVLPMAVMHRRLLTQGRAYRAAFGVFLCEDVISLRHQREDWDELVLLWLGGRRTFVMDPGPSCPDFTPLRTYSLRQGNRVQFVSAGPAQVGLCRELERHRQLVAALLGRPVAAAEILPRFERVGLGAPGGEIVITPFGTMSVRDFPEALLLDALRVVRRETDVPIRLYGDASQGPRLLQLAQIARVAGIPGVACAEPMGTVTFAATVAGARLVLSVDTATAHLAVAFDRPAVFVIGGGHPDEFVPWGTSVRQIWLTHPLDCFGCDWKCRHPEPYCITRITSATMEDAIKRVWASWVPI